MDAGRQSELADRAVMDNVILAFYHAATQEQWNQLMSMSPTEIGAEVRAEQARQESADTAPSTRLWNN